MARTLVRLNGNLGTAGQEKWSITLNYAQGDVLTEPEVALASQEIIDLLEGNWTTDYPLLRNLLSTSGSLTDVDVYAYAASGPALRGGTSAVSSPLLGTGVIVCPPQCAMVISLHTGQAGASKRGRVYWPALGATVNGSLVDSTMSNAAEEFATLANEIEQLLTPFSTASFGVYSPTLGIVTSVTRVAAGNVVDTQRRRRDGLAEFYQSFAYPPT